MLAYRLRFISFFLPPLHSQPGRAATRERGSPRTFSIFFSFSNPSPQRNGASLQPLIPVPAIPHLLFLHPFSTQPSPAPQSSAQASLKQSGKQWGIKEKKRKRERKVEDSGWGGKVKAKKIPRSTLYKCYLRISHNTQSTVFIPP